MLPFSAALITFGAVLIPLSETAAAIVAGFGCSLEAARFFLVGYKKEDTHGLG